MTGPRAPTVLLVDRYAGVRDAVRRVLAAHGIAVAGEAGGVVAARALPGEVVVANLVLPDGTAAGLARCRPVVAYTWLPEDERPPGAADGVVAVLDPGTLRAGLVEAVRSAVVRADAVGYCPVTEDPRRGHR